MANILKQIKNDIMFQEMGANESRPSIPQTQESEDVAQQPTDEKFKADVRKAANDFKNLVQGNKIMIFSATYCTYCTVAKVINNILLSLNILFKCFISENFVRYWNTVSKL